MHAGDNHRSSLLIAGVFRASEGYPNVLYRLRDLQSSPHFDVVEVNSPLWKNDAQRGAFVRLPRLAVGVVLAHLRLWFCLARAHTPDLVYVPYPGVFVLNMLPKRLRRGQVVVDAFISIYDTVVNDRRLVGSRHPLARLLHKLEKRAYDRADLIVVDTPENLELLRNEFDLPSSKLAAVPLSTNETDYAFSDYRPDSGRLRVLFVGTLVPLHGTATIVEAAARLRHRTDIEFRVIGDGQDAAVIERLIAELKPNLTWIREWQTSSDLADEIRKADICLGIFGDTAKAQRVCPLKIYAYTAVGRATVTGDTEWVRGATYAMDLKPFAVVPVADPVALAARIAELADDPDERLTLARSGRKFYESALSNNIANSRFLACVQALKA